MKPMGCHGTLVFAHLFLFFTMGLFDVERESSMVRWRGYPSIQRDQLELLTMSGDGEIQKKLRREITTVNSLSWLALFLITTVRKWLPQEIPI